ncbi:MULTISPECIES: hypothetical protein [Streptomyces]|uniref:Uncharacterized protein n=1 Tax=Streptomyces venezuelae (strain ATCC 10712 / CBS 650.69 / DSM 40230 / JCM 4526 / NBRC 13096 / PD 04745) TaxID=953739 RepID=F2RAS1_STRVP|nr:hypothetical protein [Streptomyces venezuelae]APE24662.1 hypothetical protein vnz_28950 [Streptomyces venezuelae]CCA59140.1 hypothetical protein SVEN_5854 [Streptomyces venezuelae ATCC 10712]
MLSEALTVLATTSGTAVIQAAGTDAWTGLRERVARLFGRRSERAEQATLERLDRTAAELEGATDDSAGQIQATLQINWRDRLVELLEELDDTQRDEVAEELRQIVAASGARPPASAPTAGDGGLAVGGDMSIRADGGSVAAGVIHGGVTLGPSQPGRSQG